MVTNGKVIYESTPGRYIIQRGEVETYATRIGTKEHYRSETVTWYDYAGLNNRDEAILLATDLADEHFPTRYRVIDTQEEGK